MREALGLGPNRDLDTLASPVIYENHQRGAILVERYALDRSFVFCFARHPYARCASWYKFHQHLEPYRGLSFTDWVEEGLPHHWAMQNATDYVATGLSPLLQHTFVEGCRVDFIGSMERFAEGLGIVVDRLNARCEERGEPPRYRVSELHLNASPAEPTAGQLHDDRTLALVHEQLRVDFEFFGYEP